MSAVWFRARAELRARWRASLGLALVIGLAGGLVIAAAAGARRQDSTFPKFRVAQNTAQTGIANSGAFFGFANVDFKKAEKLPEVVDSAGFNFFIGFARTSRGLQLTPIGDHNPVVFFASTDGRFDHDLNHITIIAGRDADPNAIDEVLVSYIAAEQYHISVGDVLDLAMPSYADIKDVTKIESGVLTGPRTRLRVVGIELTSFELPPGLGYPSLHLTPAFFNKYVSVVPTFPASLFKLHRDAELPAFIQEVGRSALEPGGASTRVQFFNEPGNARSIQRTLHVQATALWLLALLAGIASVLILAQAVARQTFLESDDHPALLALGMLPGQLLVSSMIRLALIALSGAVLAVVVAVVVSPLTPIGLARLVDLHPGISIDARALIIGTVALVGAVLLIGAYASMRTASKALLVKPRERPSRVADSLARASFPPSSVAGVRMALEAGSGRTAVPVRTTLFGAIVGLAALVTAFVFGSSLTHLLHTPRLVGWNWDATIGDSFDADDATRVLPVLARDPDVAEYSTGGASNVRVGDTTFAVIAQDQVKGAIVPLIREGNAPKAVDEIALGGLTLRAIHAKVGDLIQVQLEGAPVTMRIVGRAVIPPVEDPSSVGQGGFLTFEGLRRLQPKLSQDVFTVRFAAGVDPVSARNRLKKSLPDLAVDISPNVGNATDFGRIVNLPVILASLLALLAAATLIHTLLTIIRRRARDLAILKTLGFVRSQIRVAVAWQVTTLVVVALIVGVPAGIAAGRWAWDTFSDQVGFVPEPVVRALPILITIPAAIAFGNLVATLPARAAAHTRPAEVFRTE